MSWPPSTSSSSSTRSSIHGAIGGIATRSSSRDAPLAYHSGQDQGTFRRSDRRDGNGWAGLGRNSLEDHRSCLREIRILSALPVGARGGLREGREAGPSDGNKRAVSAPLAGLLDVATAITRSRMCREKPQRRPTGWSKSVLPARPGCTSPGRPPVPTLRSRNSSGQGVELRYADYSGYPDYDQKSNTFEHGVSMLDVLMRCGPAARSHLKSSDEPRRFPHPSLKRRRS